MIRFRVARSVMTSCLLVVLAILTSCGESGLKLYPVTGIVLREGNPVSDATVVFHSDASPKMATGRTDQAGRFELSLFREGDGAPAGDFVVTVSKYLVDAPPAGASTSMDSAAQQPPVKVGVTAELPAAFANPATSRLRATVRPDDANDFSFDL